MKSFKTPTWLDDVAKEYWRKTSKAIKDRLNDSNIETFAVLCDVYSMMRQCSDPKGKKLLIDAYIRLSTQFGLTPRSDKLAIKKEIKPVNFFGDSEAK